MKTPWHSSEEKPQPVLRLNRKGLGSDTADSPSHLNPAIPATAARPAAPGPASASASGAAGVRASRRDQFLDKLAPTQQVEILKWAEQHQIKPDEALWLLVDLLGYTQFMTETLPSQMRAAGQQAVEAIAQQRRAEADAFSANAQQALAQMLTPITAQVAAASEAITTAKLRRQLWCHGLWAASGIALLAAMCCAFGYALASLHLPWIEHASENNGIRMAQMILGLPIGYLIVPLMGTAMALFSLEEIKRWREQ